MFLTPEAEASFRDLVEALKSGDVTAFIGAGLSVPLQPTWSRLHTDLQRESEIKPVRPFDAVFAPADFADFRDAMAPERYLAMLKERFGSVVTDYPPLYRVIDETQGFVQLVTTNYDEFLATAAQSSNRRPSISVYPDLGNLGARYIYLHGRARSARRPEDFVLCEDDYGRAYEVPGWAADMLRALFMRPGVFIGSSLQDPDLLALLRRRSRHRIADAASPDPPLFAIVPVSANRGDRSEEAVAAAATIAEHRLRRLGVRAICYGRDRGHTQLRATLLQLQHEVERRPVEPVFLDRTRRLNRLGAIASPSPSEVTEVVETISGIPELARHFFTTSAISIAWYELLKDALIVPGVIEPWDIGGGQRKIGGWAAGPFVQRVALHRPEIVVELIERLGMTENWEAQSILSRMAADLPAEQLNGVVAVLARWMRGQNAAFNRVADFLASVPDRLCKTGSFDVASTLIGYLLQARKDIRGNRGELLVDEYRYPEVRAAIEQLAATRPNATYRLLKTRLLRALSAVREDEGERSSSWRPSIGEDDQNFKLLEPGLHFLLDATRDVLLTWITHSPTSAEREVSRLIRSELGLLQRLAIHASMVSPDLIQQIQGAIQTKGLLWNRDVFHELALLISERFGHLDDLTQTSVHHQIKTGPPAHVLTPGEDPTELVDSFRWLWLALLPEIYQTASEREWWDGLRVRNGERERPHFLFWNGPIEMQEFQPDVVDVSSIRTAWQTGGAPALATALRLEAGGWGPLADMIREDPEGLGELTEYIGPQDGDRLASYFSGYESLLGSQTVALTFPWMRIFDLMERTVQADLTDLEGTARQIGRLIERGIASDVNRIPADFLACAQNVASLILGQFAQSLDSDAKQAGRMGRHHNLNHTAGIAADGFMRGVWQQLYNSRDDEERKLPDGSKPWLDAAVDQGWGGLELRHALGEFGFVIQWGDPHWLTRNASALWPSGDTPASVNARRAFLLGYLQSQRFALATFNSFTSLYHDVVRDLSRTEREYLDEHTLIEPFLRHLVVGWLNDMDGFQDVLEEFLAIAPDEYRASFVRLLGREFLVASEQKGLDFEATIRKREAFWVRRVADLEKHLSITTVSEELSAFFLWATDYPRPLARLESRLRVSIDHLSGGHGIIRSLLKCFIARGEAEPLPAARLLERLIDRLIGEEQLHWRWNQNELGEAFDAICRGALPNHRVHLRNVANRLVQVGEVEYSEKLTRCGVRRARTAKLA